MPEVIINLPELPFEYEYTGEYKVPLKDEYILVNHKDGTRVLKQGEEYGAGYVFYSPCLIVRKRFDFPPVSVKISDIYSEEMLKRIPSNYRPISFRMPISGDWYLTDAGRITRFDSLKPTYPRLIVELVGYKKEDF